MRDLKISRLLVIFGMVVTLGLAGSIGLQTLAFETLKIGGPQYQDIINGKDVLADILPPPLYVIEAYMLASEGAIQPELAASNAKKIAALKSSYDERRSVWQASNLAQDLKDELENQVLRTGDSFWSTVDSNYMPAVAANDVAAMRASLNEVRANFHAHDAAVKTYADHCNAFLVNAETKSEMSGFWLKSFALSGSGISALILLAGLWFLRHRAIAPLSKITQYMSVLAAGDLSKDVPMTGRRDEIGVVAQSVDVFRMAAIERARLRKETEESRARSEAETAERARAHAEDAKQLQIVVETLGAGLRRLAECNIRMTIDEPFSEKFEPLRRDFNNSIAMFQATLEQVLTKTSQLSESSGEMHEAADNLSKRTEKQAAALEQTSAALDQVTSTVRSSVERTAETRGIVREARECASTSGKVVREAVEAMKRIESASGEISQIIDVIDQIAFQTNLLALNAGVEAARAGDAGKGFAVVAQEVRELAQRSAHAAKDITALIRKSTEEVSHGVRLVDQTGHALDRITGFVSEINMKVEAITTASEEQSVGLQEISTAVNAIDQMTQQNAAMVEETTAISSALASDAATLAQLVQRFKLNRRMQMRELGSADASRQAAA